ncbi:MAG: hypothetical protein N2167_05125 [Flavobacteriales bacterium]|nr:hypothetical protein [Flavobacteriales bacterium]
MATVKKIGVFMDHSKAELIRYENGAAGFIETILSEHGGRDRYEGEGSDETRFSSDPYHGSNNEFKKHRIEENDLHAYYKNLSKELEHYDEILLFGPGEAKKEFKNYVEQMHAFQNKRLHVENSDKLTENQLLEFVREYFKPVQK